MSTSKKVSKFETVKLELQGSITQKCALNQRQMWRTRSRWGAGFPPERAPAKDLAIEKEEFLYNPCSGCSSNMVRGQVRLGN
ncbi:MAG: hypothetical protein CXZ00_09805 [Acidobacteria bacterium]|nr:MAG: hypothetical protein CXZ00_09805 [Acidobacteriota bacterium]